MEPVKGGNLANLSSSAEAILMQQRPEASMASWALRWVGSKEGVITMNKVDLTVANQLSGLLVRGTVNQQCMPFPIDKGLKAKMPLIRFT